LVDRLGCSEKVHDLAPESFAIIKEKAHHLRYQRSVLSKVTDKEHYASSIKSMARAAHGVDV
jgi:hypothetical protein